MSSHNKNLMLTLALLFSAACFSQTSRYEDLLDHRSGFAAGVTGGAGGKVITITATGDEGFKQLKKAINWNDDRQWIRFSPGLSGSILIDGELFIGSNTTIDGRGADITFEGKNLDDAIWVWSDKNVIVHNIRFYRIGHAKDEGQGLGLTDGADNVWVDHCTFELNGDESLSMGYDKAAYRVTASYCRWYNTEKCILAGWSAEEGENIQLTVHHSTFVGGPDFGVSRIPLLRLGMIHFYNNYVKDVGWAGAQIHENGEALMENNYYHSSGDVMYCDANNPWDPEPGWICERGNIFKGGATKIGPGFDCEKVFDARDYYDYYLDGANSVMIQMLLDYSGRSANPQWLDSYGKHSLIINSRGRGSVNLSSGWYEAGSTVTLTATPDSGYQFKEWRGDITGTTNPVDVIMDADKTITAKFVVATSIRAIEANDKYSFQNYPNPFNASTTIEYSLEQLSPVHLGVYNTLGQRVRTLEKGTMAQKGKVVWDGKNEMGAALNSGIYYVKMSADNKVDVRKIIYLK